MGRFRMDDNRFAIPPAYEPNNINERLFMDDERCRGWPQVEIERAAYRAVGLLHPIDVEQANSLHHHLGTFTIGESEAAICQAIEIARKSGEAAFFDYPEYCHAVGSHGALASRVRSDNRAIENYEYMPYERAINRPYPDHSTTDTERRFLELFQRSKHTSNLDGYLRYLEAVEPELATIMRKPLPVFFPEEPCITHTYIVGTTGSGKTELMKLFIHSYVTHPKSAAVVVLDPAGDFAKEIKCWPEFNTGNRLIYLKHDLKSGMVPVLNPFEMAALDPLDISRKGILGKRVASQELQNAISLILGSDGGDFSVNMKRLLGPCILTLFDQPGATLLDLHRFMIDKDGINSDLVEFALTRTHHDGVVQFFQNEFRESNFDVTKRSIATKLGSLFSTGFFTEMTCGESTFNLKDALNQKKIIVFDLSKGNLGPEESVAVGRLIMASLQSIALSRDEIPRSQRVPIHAFVDECHNFLTPTVKEILRESRKYGLHLTLCQQNIGQEMNQEMRRAILSLTTVKFCGKMEPDQRERAGRQMDLPPARIAEVAAGKGRFFVRFGEHPPFKMRARTDLLGVSHSMTLPSQKALTARQLRCYYRSVVDLRDAEAKQGSASNTDSAFGNFE